MHVLPMCWGIKIDILSAMSHYNFTDYRYELFKFSIMPVKINLTNFALPVLV